MWIQFIFRIQLFSQVLVWIINIKNWLNLQIIIFDNTPNLPQKGHNSVTNRIQQQVKQRQCQMFYHAVLEETPRYEKTLSLIMPKINLAEDAFLCLTDAILSTNLGLL